MIGRLYFTRPWRLVYHSLYAILCTSLLIGLLSGCHQTIPVVTDEFDTCLIGTMPRLDGVFKLMVQANEPFVAMNALIFKDHATGEKYKGLTGEEAYTIYTDGLVDVLSEMNSRLIWSGRAQNQIIGESDPAFERFILLEYANPNKLLQLMTHAGDAPDARAAGLLGQWNISTKTVYESGRTAISVAQESLPDIADLVFLTGMTEAQINLLMAAPEGEPVFIVEMLRFSDPGGTRYAPYQEALASVYDVYGAVLTWRGKFNFFFIGRSVPKFHQMIVTMYPNPAAYLSMLSDPRVTVVLDSKKDGLAIHWAYTAVEMDSDI